MATRLEYGYRDRISRNDHKNFLPAELAHLIPCTQITDPTLSIGIVSNGTVQPRRFSLTSKDRQPIILTGDSERVFEMRLAGKSAFLYVENAEPGKDVLSGLVGQSFNREPTRDDHLHLALIGDIHAAGWQVWWTPLPDRNNWTHVRLVANRTEKEGLSPTVEDGQSLAQVFSKAA